MADIPKIAGTFEAFRLTVGVEPNKLGWFIKMCLKMGIQINPTNELRDDNIVCRVTMPADSLAAFNGTPIGKCCMHFKSEKIWLMCPMPKTDLLFSIWRTIKVGGITQIDDLPEAVRKLQNDLTHANVEIDNWAIDMLGKRAFVIAIGEIEIDLVRTSVAKLGFSEGAKCYTVYDRAFEFGLQLCPRETASRICLQCRNQLRNQLKTDECLRICSETIHTMNSPRIFAVCREKSKKLRLVGVSAEQDGHLHQDYELVFQRPRK